MVELFYSALLLVFALFSFQNVYCVGGVQRAYLGLYKGIAEEAVVVAATEGEYAAKPLFYLPRLRENLRLYFQVNLKPYCLAYSYSCQSTLSSPLFPAEGPGLGEIPYANEIVISFSAKITDWKTVDKEAYFRIERTEHEPK